MHISYFFISSIYILCGHLLPTPVSFPLPVLPVHHLTYTYTYIYTYTYSSHFLLVGNGCRYGGRKEKLEEWNSDAERMMEDELYWSPLVVSYLISGIASSVSFLPQHPMRLHSVQSAVFLLFSSWMLLLPGDDSWKQAPPLPLFSVQWTRHLFCTCYSIAMKLITALSSGLWVLRYDRWRAFEGCRRLSCQCGLISSCLFKAQLRCI